jgi:hypothetical protein
VGDQTTPWMGSTCRNILSNLSLVKTSEVSIETWLVELDRHFEPDSYTTKILADKETSAENPRYQRSVILDL